MRHKFVVVVKFWKGFGASEGGNKAEAAFQASAATLLQSL